MSEEKQAQRLARWIDDALRADGPPPDPPEDLDDDVREAFAALRPDRAPAPRVTADDLLASLTAGPLAHDGGRVVRFPGAVEAPPRRWWRSAGGAGGVGLLLAAAGVLYFLRLDSAVLEAPAPQALTPASGEAAPAEVAAAKQEVASPDTVDAPPLQTAAGRSASAPAPATKGAPPVDLRTTREAPLPISKEGEATRTIAEAERKALPPAELAGADANAAPDPALAELDDAVAAADEDAGLAGDVWQQGYAAPIEEQVQAAAPQKRDQQSKKAAASRADNVVTEEEPPPPAAAPPARQTVSFGWAEGLDGQAQAQFDTARARAQSLASTGRYAEAAATLSAVVGPPARAGMHHAALAVDYWLLAGDRDAAVAIATQGLALSSEDSPERTALLARLEQARAYDTLERSNDEMYMPNRR